MTSFLRWIATDVRSGKNTDLWLLIAAGVIAIVLSAIGVADNGVLSSITLALLSLLAISLIRQRQFLTNGMAAVVAGPPLYSAFPLETIGQGELRETAVGYEFIGNAMGRTLQTGGQMIERIVREGGIVSVVVVNPVKDHLLEMVATCNSRYNTMELVKNQVLSSLEVLEAIRERVGSGLQIKVVDWPPKASINHFVQQDGQNLVMVQHYEFLSDGEPTPIMVFRQDEGPWYQHFVNEVARISDAAETWTRSAASLR